MNRETSVYMSRTYILQILELQYRTLKKLLDLLLNLHKMTITKTFPILELPIYIYLYYYFSFQTKRSDETNYKQPGLLYIEHLR